MSWSVRATSLCGSSSLDSILASTSFTSPLNSCVSAAHLFHEFFFEGASLGELEASLLGEVVAFFVAHLPTAQQRLLLREVELVSDQRDEHLAVSVVSELVEPGGDLLERGLAGSAAGTS